MQFFFSFLVSLTHLTNQVYTFRVVLFCTGGPGILFWKEGKHKRRNRKRHNNSVRPATPLCFRGGQARPEPGETEPSCRCCRPLVRIRFGQPCVAERHSAVLSVLTFSTLANWVTSQQEQKSFLTCALAKSGPVTVFSQSYSVARFNIDWFGFRTWIGVTYFCLHGAAQAEPQLPDSGPNLDSNWNLLDDPFFDNKQSGSVRSR